MGEERMLPTASTSSRASRMPIPTFSPLLSLMSSTVLTRQCRPYKTTSTAMPTSTNFQVPREWKLKAGMAA